MRWLIAIGFALTSCSFITDFDPGKANSGGAGGIGGTGGMSGGGSGGTGGMSIDAPPDSRHPDAQVDARPDAPLVCTSSSQCDDGYACTSDTCVFPGMCQHSNNNGFCVTPNQCTGDFCDPSASFHDSCGCTRTYVQCNSGEICLADRGCTTVSCSAGNPCPEPADCCLVARCENMTCHQVPRCTNGQTCIYNPDPSCGVPTSCFCQ